jgi:formate dehydrogenase major subunit
MDEPSPESILREINRAVWTIGYTGQSPERLKAHMRNMHVFDVKSLRAKGGIDEETGYKLDGDFFGLPWPCFGTPELKPPGSPNLYNTAEHVMDGGGNFRANFGVERDGVSLLAGDGSHSKGAEITTGYPEFTADMLEKLGWWDDLTDAEKAAAEGKNWKTDLSGGIQRVAMKHGCHPFGNAKARAVVWNFPDAIPKHREPLYSNRADLVAKYPTHDDKAKFWRLPTLFKTVQERYKDVGQKYPLVMTSGRLVEYEGGGEETRSNPWLAELQQDMFVEINPKAANDRGIRNGDLVWVRTPPMEGVPGFNGIRVKALVTERVNHETVFLPFHFSGRWGGVDLLPYYPEGAHPVVRGEAVNTATTYGYDSVTMMQETKTTVCQIEKATA